MVNCVEHLRLARANDDADREFRVAHVALMMTGQTLAFRRDALLAVNLARKKSEACRTALDYYKKRCPSLETEYRMRHKDESWRWVLARAQAVWDDFQFPFQGNSNFPVWTTPGSSREFGGFGQGSIRSDDCRIRPSGAALGGAFTADRSYIRWSGAVGIHAPAPFLLGMSFLGTTPLTVNRTPMVLSFAFELVTRNSFDAISSGRAARPTRIFTN